MFKTQEVAKDFLAMGAKHKVVVRINYRHLDDKYGFEDRFAYVQPVQWMVGRKGIHILTWDVEKENWRRFALKNILEVTVTDIKWVKPLQSNLAGF